MLLLQALITLLRRSAGKIIEAIFGWAVAALFGDIRKSEKTLLSAVVAAVAFWPVLLAGIAFPKIAAFVLALVPLPKDAPDELLRVVWAALALILPIVVGYVLQRREGNKKWNLRAVLAGFPLTAGLSTAFLLAFVALPFQKLTAILRGLAEEQVTLITEEADFDEVAAAIRRALDADGFALAPGLPSRPARAIAGVLRSTAALVGKTANRPRHYRGPDLELTLSAQGATIRGLRRAVSRAHAVIACTATRTPALQTTDAEAQKLERRIKVLWTKAGRGRSSGASLSLYGEVVRSLSRLSCPYDDWEIVYRECLQLGLVFEGIPDPIAPSGGSRFQPDARARDRSRRLAFRARGATREKAMGGATKTVTKLARRMADSLIRRVRLP